MISFSPFGIVIFLLTGFHWFDFLRLELKDKENILNDIENLILCAIIMSLFFDHAIILNAYGNEIRLLEWFYYSLVGYMITLGIKEYFSGVKMQNRQVKILIASLIYIIINNLSMSILPLKYKAVTLPNLWYDFFHYGDYQFPQITKSVLVYDFYFFVSIYSILKLSDYFDKDSLKNIGKKMSKLWHLPLFIFVLELAVKKILDVNIFYELRDILMGINIDSVATISRGSVNVFFGFNSEPSSFAQSIFWMILLMLLYNPIDKKILFKFGVLSIIGLFTGSMLFLVYFIFSISLMLYKTFLFSSKEQKRKIIFSVVISLMLLVIVSINIDLYGYFSKRLGNVVKILKGYDLEYSSEVSRIITSVKMLEIFLHRPIFGAGIGTYYGFSTVFSFLSNFGLLGTYLYLLATRELQKNSRHNKSTVLVFMILIVVTIIQGNINQFLFLPIWILKVILVTNSHLLEEDYVNV